VRLVSLVKPVSVRVRSVLLVATAPSRARVTLVSRLNVPASEPRVMVVVLETGPTLWAKAGVAR
jgi:hypothetical protein